MRNLLLIFAATTGYARLIITSLVVIVITLGGSLYLGSRFDADEVRLRNRILAQQHIAMITYDATENKDLRPFLAEQQKLIDYKSEYDSLRETWLGKLFLGGRPPVPVKTIISRRARDAYEGPDGSGE